MGVIRIQYENQCNSSIELRENDVYVHTSPINDIIIGENTIQTTKNENLSLQTKRITNPDDNYSVIFEQATGTDKQAVVRRSFVKFKAQTKGALALRVRGIYVSHTCSPDIHFEIDTNTSLGNEAHKLVETALKTKVTDDFRLATVQIPIDLENSTFENIDNPYVNVKINGSITIDNCRFGAVECNFEDKTKEVIVKNSKINTFIITLKGAQEANVRDLIDISENNRIDEVTFTTAPMHVTFSGVKYNVDKSKIKMPRKVRSIYGLVFGQTNYRSIEMPLEVSEVWNTVISNNIRIVPTNGKCSINRGIIYGETVVEGNTPDEKFSVEWKGSRADRLIVRGGDWEFSNSVQESIPTLGSIQEFLVENIGEVKKDKTNESLLLVDYLVIGDKVKADLTKLIILKETSKYTNSIVMNNKNWCGAHVIISNDKRYQDLPAVVKVLGSMCSSLLDRLAEVKEELSGGEKGKIYYAKAVATLGKATVDKLGIDQENAINADTIIYLNKRANAKDEEASEENCRKFIRCITSKLSKAERELINTDLEKYSTRTFYEDELNEVCDMWKHTADGTSTLFAEAPLNLLSIKNSLWGVKSKIRKQAKPSDSKYEYSDESLLFKGDNTSVWCLKYTREGKNLRIYVVAVGEKLSIVKTIIGSIPKDDKCAEFKKPYMAYHIIKALEVEDLVEEGTSINTFKGKILKNKNLQQGYRHLRYTIPAANTGIVVKNGKVAKITDFKEAYIKYKKSSLNSGYLTVIKGEKVIYGEWNPNYEIKSAKLSEISAMNLHMLFRDCAVYRSYRIESDKLNKLVERSVLRSYRNSGYALNEYEIALSDFAEVMCGAGIAGSKDKVYFAVRREEQSIRLSLSSVETICASLASNKKKVAIESSEHFIRYFDRTDNTITKIYR